MKTNPTQTVNELISMLSYFVDLERNRNLYHSWRVAVLSAAMSKKRMSKKKTQETFYASLLHDVGGVEFNHHIIHYLKRRDKASRNILLSHPIIGAQLVAHIPELTEAAKLILDHHEWINGTGYPRAKTQKYISLGSQIIRIADAVDIIFAKNPSIPFGSFKKTLKENAGKEFSASLCNGVLNALKRKRFFSRIADRENTPALLQEAQQKIGVIHIPSKIDAIGTTLEVVAQIIDMKHPYTSGHSLRVSRYALACALAMNLEHDEITHIKWAGLLHDIGKLSISRRILDKPSGLTKQEFSAIKQHALLTRKFINMIPSLKNLGIIAISHHEFFDGSGYPYGLKGEEIPLAARILTICDAFDAMTSNRPYRTPITPQEACIEIQKRAGTQFDPRVVEQAIPLFKHLGL
jgi:HD-GYP domain-containing protein (c-di-GMP phosphodiesterase class II)